MQRIIGQELLLVVVHVQENWSLMTADSSGDHCIRPEKLPDGIESYTFHVDGDDAANNDDEGAVDDE